MTSTGVGAVEAACESTKYEHRSPRESSNLSFCGLQNLRAPGPLPTVIWFRNRLPWAPIAANRIPGPAPTR